MITPPPSDVVRAVPLAGVDGRNVVPLLSEEAVGSIRGVMTWTVGGTRGSGGEPRVRIFVEVEGRDLLQGSPELPIVLNVVGYLVDESGAVVDHLSQEIRIEKPRQVEIIEEGGLRFVGDLAAPPGRSSCRVLIRNTESQRFYLDRRSVDIPTEESDVPSILPPLVADRTKSWVVAVESDLPHTGEPAFVPGFDAWPSAMPVWRSGERLEVVVGGPDPAVLQRLSARLVDRLGPTLTDLDIEVAGEQVDSNGLSFFRASIAPPDVPAGEYRLALVATDRRSTVSTTRLLPVLIHHSTEVSVWTDPQAPRAPVLRRTSSQPESVETAATPAEESSASTAAGAVSPEERFVGGDPDAPPPSGPIPALQLGGVGGRAAALLLSGQSGGGVAGAVVWVLAGSGEDENGVPITVVIEVSGRDLLTGSRALPISIEVYAFLLDGTGTVIDHLAEGVIVDGRPWARKIEESGLKFVGEMRAHPGEYSLRVLVRNRQTQQFFLARSDLEARSRIGAEPFLLPPLVDEPGQGWQVVVQHDLAPEAARGSFHGTTGWPAAMPAWRSEDSLSIVLGGSELGTGRVVTAHLLDRDGHQVIDPEITVEAGSPQTGDLRFYRAKVAAPDVPVGEYRLEVDLTDSTTGQVASQSLPVLVHDQTDGLVWTGLAAQRAVEPVPTAAGAAEPIAGETGQEAMRAAYLEALRLWSEDDTFAARRALADLERPVAAAASDARWRQLFTTERTALRTLAEDNPATVLAVALLHRDMYRWYLSRRETQLAEHSRDMAVMIARAAPSIRNWDPPEGFTECLLLDLAGHLAQTGQLQPAREMLQLTVEEVPTSSAALLGLGALYERTGHPAEAVKELERLIEVDPRHSEGRLRLAVNLHRVGENDVAEEILRDLLATDQPLWIRTVAYQELGRVLADQQRLGEAERLLRQGLGELPGSQHLRVLLAHVLDVAGRPREATAEITRVTPVVADETISPRYLYAMWPDLDGERVRSTLAAAGEQGREALRHVLREDPPQPPSSS